MSEISNGDRVRLKRTLPMLGVTPQDEAYASALEDGVFRRVWFRRLQQYWLIHETDLELVARYVPTKAVLTKDGDYIYLDGGEVVPVAEEEK